MLYFKACLRCKNGTVELGSDNFGLYLNCLTCGYTINSRSIRSNGEIEEPVTREEDAARVPVLAPGRRPVALADDSGEIDVDKVSDEFGPEPDMSLFDDDLEDFSRKLQELKKDPIRARLLANRASETVAAHTGASLRTLEVLRPLFQNLSKAASSAGKIEAEHWQQPESQRLETSL